MMMMMVIPMIFSLGRNERIIDNIVVVAIVVTVVTVIVTVIVVYR